MGKGLGVGTFDMDDDGWCDVAVANDTVQNFLFRNRKDGTFEEIGILSGFAFDEAGRTRGAMGIDWSETGDGGAKAIVVGNFSNEITALYRSDRPGLIPFSDDATAEGIGNPSRKYMKFGVFFFDLDLDGRLDIFEANGHLEVEIEKVQASRPTASPCRFSGTRVPARRAATRRWARRKWVRTSSVPSLGAAARTRISMGDGDLDVVLVPNGGAARLFRNDGGNRNHWVRLKLVGKPGNTNAFGARVSARVGGEERRFQLSSGRSYLSQCEQVITIGLGSGTKAEAVKVFWPGQSAAQDVGEVPAGTLLEVKQP
jgi:hypothetical protein